MSKCPCGNITWMRRLCTKCGKAMREYQLEGFIKRFKKYSGHKRSCQKLGALGSKCNCGYTQLLIDFEGDLEII